MNILITGSRGFVGGRLSTFLIKKGYKVTKLSRYNKQGFKKINWNSDKQLAKVCRGKDVLINCLGVDINHANDFKKANLVNSFLPKKLLSTADKQGVKYFIFLSTYHVYDLREKQINEYSKIKGTNNYNKSKIRGERNLLDYKKKIKLIIIRPCNLFGRPIYKNKNCWKLLINELSKKLALNQKITLRAKFNEYRAYSSIESFNNFIFALLRKIQRIEFKNNNFITNYTSNFNLRITDVIQILYKIFKLEKKQIRELTKKLRNIGHKKVYLSLNQKKISNKTDKFFYKELRDLKKYLLINKR